MRSLSSLRGVDPGFDAENVWTGSIDIPEAKYATPQSRNQFFDRVIESVRALPGVQSAARIDTIPFGGGSIQYVTYDGLPAMKDSELPVVQVRLRRRAISDREDPVRVGPRLHRGRTDFSHDARDDRQRKTRERLFPGQDPIGRHITWTMMRRSRRRSSAWCAK
jgi:hypothetical protein